MGCDIGHRRGSDPMLLWLWYRPVATALIGPLAWEPPYAMGTALEKAKDKIIIIIMMMMMMKTLQIQKLLRIVFDCISCTLTH